MLTGENGIINRTTSAKKTNEEAEVMENIRLAYNNAQIGRHSGANEIFEDKMDSDLEVTYGEGSVNISKEEKIYVITIIGKGTYEITADGNVGKAGANIEITGITFKDENGNEITTRIQGEGTVYIHFKASLRGGTISSVTSENLTPTLTNEEWITPVTANGTYTFTITGSVDNETKTKNQDIIVNKFSKLPSGLQIGSEVTYVPTPATYTWMGEYATNAEITVVDDKNTTSDDTTLSNSGGYNARWKVLDIDNDTEAIKLVPEKPSISVKLFGANGYNNAVYLLNEACKTLYTNTSLGITSDNVRNINIEDIEGALKKSVVESSKNTCNHNNPSYDFLNQFDQVSSPHSQEASYYPSIYAKESKAVINGQTNIGTWNESQQACLFKRNGKIEELQVDGITKIEKTATNGYIQANTSIQPYQTYYSGINFSDNEIENKIGQLDVLAQKSYWVASRCVFTSTYRSDFYIFSVTGGYNTDPILTPIVMFGSNNYTWNKENRCIFPIITIRPELVIKNDSDKFVVGE